MNKTILITGSTDGIGKLAAIKMASEGHHIYLHGRNEEKLKRVMEEVKSSSSNDNIDGFVADFSDLDQVRKMIEEVKNKTNSIDILVNNAGIFKTPREITKHKIDVRIVVNYLAPYLLTYGLLDIIKQGKEPRIINLSSAAQSEVSAGLLNGNIKVSSQEAYAQSKLAILIWSFYLAEQEPKITSIALNPGSLLNTNMVREAYGRYWSSADKGANIIHEVSLSDIHSGNTGKYYDNDKGGYGPAHSDAYNSDKINKLIDATESILTAYK